MPIRIIGSATPVRYALSAERRLSHAIPTSVNVSPPASKRALPKRRVSLGTIIAAREVRDCRRQECKAGREGAVAQHALKELGGEEPEPHHGAEVEHARRVGADALAVCKEA